MDTRNAHGLQFNLERSDAERLIIRYSNEIDDCLMLSGRQGAVVVVQRIWAHVGERGYSAAR